MEKADSIEAQITPANLAASHTAWATKVALNVIRQRNLPRWHQEELISEARVGLVEAARRYDPERGASFTTYAYRRVAGQMFDFLRRVCSRLSSANEEQLTDAGAFEENLGARLHLRELLSTLPERERSIVVQHHFFGVSLTEIGEASGIDQSWVSRLHARALIRMRNHERRRAYFPTNTNLGRQS